MLTYNILLYLYIENKLTFCYIKTCSITLLSKIIVIVLLENIKDLIYNKKLILSLRQVQYDVI